MEMIINSTNTNEFERRRALGDARIVPIHTDTCIQCHYITHAYSVITYKFSLYVHAVGCTYFDTYMQDQVM